MHQIVDRDGAPAGFTVQVQHTTFQVHILRTQAQNFRETHPCVQGNQADVIPKLAALLDGGKERLGLIRSQEAIAGVVHLGELHPVHRLGAGVQVPFIHLVIDAPHIADDQLYAGRSQTLFEQGIFKVSSSRGVIMCRGLFSKAGLR